MPKSPLGLTRLTWSIIVHAILAITWVVTSIVSAETRLDAFAADLKDHKKSSGHLVLSERVAAVEGKYDIIISELRDISSRLPPPPGPH